MSGADRRREETTELLAQLRGHGPDMEEKDRTFYSKILDLFTYHEGTTCTEPRITSKQLFWLRDLRDRYVLGTEG